MGPVDNVDLTLCHNILLLSIAYSTLIAKQAAEDKMLAIEKLCDNASNDEKAKLESRPWPITGRMPFVLLEDLLEVSMIF